MHGDKTVNARGMYGIKGVSSPLNKPKARMGGVGWKDLDGNFWIFGGWGDTALNQGGRLNDLWKYTIATNEWTWMKGDSTVHNQSVWGLKGVESQANTPGSRVHSIAWTDRGGKFWLYGGDGGYSPSPSTYINEGYDDLWKFDPVTNNWTWVSGNQSASITTPGARMRSAGATDSNGDLLLFGGAAPGGACCFYNDVWKYNIASNQWSKMRGSSSTNPTANYGVKNIASLSNDPYGLSGSMLWGDNAGSIWMFAGNRDASWPGRWYNTLLKLSPATLPVKLLSFTGTANKGKSFLNWFVEKEVNFDRYQILRSTDGRDYKKVADVQGENKQQYAYTDNIESLASPKVFYRLKMIDKEGKSELSNTILLRPGQSNVMQLYPNPARDHITLSFAKLLPGKSDVVITDIAGKEMMRCNYENLSSGTTIPINRFSAGTYILNILNKIENYQTPFIIY